jgi:hypothetical protein
MAEVDPPRIPRFGVRPLVIAAALGAIGLVLSIIAIAMSPERALLGYLVAYVTVAAIAIGALILLLIGYTANARWLAPLRRVQEGVAIVFPALIVLFVPIALGLEYIYPWAAGDVNPAKASWLAPVPFVLRSALYLAVFTGTAELLRRWSRRRDGVEASLVHDHEHELRRERRFAAAMLPPVGLAVTFAAFDWLMSLQPAWFSSMFGVYYFGAGFSAAVALIVIIAWRLREDLVDELITPQHFHALGRLLLAFVVFWAYASYFQGFLIQIANRPIEVEFFVRRTQGGWYGWLWALLITHFALPFFLLLPRRLKLRPRYLASVAVLVLIGHVLDMFWLVVPSHDTALNVHWGDLPALVGIAGLCIALASWRQRGVPMFATGDPFVPAGIRYESST